MSIKTIITLILLLSISLAQATGWGLNPSASYAKDFFKVEKISVQTNATGYFSQDTGPIWGELEGIYYDNGNFTAVGTATVKCTVPSALQIDSYNLSTGDAFRVTGSKVLSSTDAWQKYQIMAPLRISLSGAQAYKVATLYLVYK